MVSTRVIAYVHPRRVRSAAGLRTVGWSYEQRGVVATVETRYPNGTAWQRFLPEGPLALLPARGNYSNIVWSTTPDKVRHLPRTPSARPAALCEPRSPQAPIKLRARSSACHQLPCATCRAGTPALSTSPRA